MIPKNLISSFQLTNYLFKEPSKDWGFDLVAFNVWRGRDHGLPGYNKYRESMGLKKAKTWYDLSDVFTPQVSLSNLSLLVS